MTTKGTGHLYWGEQLGAGGEEVTARSASLTGSPSGSSVSVSQAGNRPTPAVFRIGGGSCRNPSIVRESDGARIALVGQVANGFLEVDTFARQVLFQGVTPLLKYIDASSTTWDLAARPSPGTETYRLVASEASGATLEVRSRSAFA